MMRRSPAKFLFLLLVTSMPVTAVETLQVTRPEPLLEPWRWREFELPGGGGFQAMYEDTQGRIWFATSRGVHRYDGLQWVSYYKPDGLIDDHATAVTQTLDGTMWFGTERGISSFDGEDWHSYTRADGLAGDSVADGQPLLARRDGSLWAGFWSAAEGDSSGLSRFDGGRWSTVALPDGVGAISVRELAESPEGSLWMGTVGHGVWQRRAGDWQQHDGVPSNGHCADLEVESDESVWAACWGQGVYHWDGRTWDRFEVPRPPYILRSVWRNPDGSIWSGGPLHMIRLRPGPPWTLGPDQLRLMSSAAKGYSTNDGSVWFGFYGNPTVMRFDPRGRSTVYSHEDGLYGGIPSPDGSVWFHTPERAVRFGDGRWVAFDAADGFLDGGVVGAEGTRDGAVWFFGGHKGLAAAARRLGDEWQIWTEADGVVDVGRARSRDVRTYSYLPSPLVEGEDGSFWLLGQHDKAASVSHWDGRRWRRSGAEDGLSGDLANAGYLSSSGDLWVGTLRDGDFGAGLYRLEAGRWRDYGGEPGVVSSLVTGIAEWPRGVLWFGTKLGLTRATPLQDGSLQWWSKTDLGVSLPKPRSLQAMSSGLWFAHIPNRSGGVGHFDGEEWHRLGQGDGLPGDGVSHIAVDADSALWFVGAHGVSRSYRGAWQRYGREEGLYFDWIFPTLRPMPDGGMWIDTSDGRVVHLENRAGEGFPRTQLPTLPRQITSDGVVSLTWKGEDSWQETPASDLLYQWRLDDEDWSAWSRRRELTLTRLTAGAHRFEVRAMDRDGNIEPAPPAHAFSVDLPWWQAPRFAVPVGLLVMLAMLQTLRVVRRDARLRRANEKLQEEIEARIEQDIQLIQLHYLNRLREQLATAPTAEELLRVCAAALQEALTGVSRAGVRIELDDGTWQVGENVSEAHVYERALTWAGRERGRLRLECERQLSEAQEQGLLDETAAQLSGALEARELAAQIVQSARLVSMGQMAAAMAHELHQPLTVISGAAEFLYLRYADDLAVAPETLMGKLGDVIRLAERMADTVNEMRVFSRDTSSEPGVAVDINQVLEAGLRLVQAQLDSRAISVEQELQGDLPVITGHPHQLEQVFVNLLANARDAFDEAGTSAARRIALRTSETVMSGSVAVLVEVVDDGVGMDVAQQERIFEPFYTTKDAEHGTGLGLAIVYSIVHRHGGQITCSSQLGKGTTIRVILPAKSVTEGEAGS